MFTLFWIIITVLNISALIALYEKVWFTKSKCHCGDNDQRINNPNPQMHHADCPEFGSCKEPISARYEIVEFPLSNTHLVRYYPTPSKYHYIYRYNGIKTSASADHVIFMNKGMSISECEKLIALHKERHKYDPKVIKIIE